MTNSGYSKARDAFDEAFKQHFEQPAVSTAARDAYLEQGGYGPSSSERPDMRALLDSWYVAQKDLAEIQARERELRCMVIDTAFADRDPDTKGTKRVPLDFGMELVANFRINHKIDKEALTEAFTKRNADSQLLARVFRFEPKVNEKEYNQLSHNELGVISQFVTDTPGLPALEIKKAK